MHRLDPCRVETREVELGQRPAALEHRVHLVDAAGVEGGQVEALQALACREHPSHVAYVAGIEPGQVDCGEALAAEEHPCHRPDPARVEAREVEGCERGAVAEHVRHIGRPPRVEAGKVQLLESTAAVERPSHLLDPARVELGEVAGGHTVESVEPVSRGLRRDALVDDLDGLDVSGVGAPRARGEILGRIHGIRRPALNRLALLRDLLAPVEAQRLVGVAVHREGPLLPHGLGIAFRYGSALRRPLVVALANLLYGRPGHPVVDHGRRDGAGRERRAGEHLVGVERLAHELDDARAGVVEQAHQVPAHLTVRIAGRRLPAALRGGHEAAGRAARAGPRGGVGGIHARRDLVYDAPRLSIDGGAGERGEHCRAALLGARLGSRERLGLQIGPQSREQGPSGGEVAVPVADRVDLRPAARCGHSCRERLEALVERGAPVGVGKLDLSRRLPVLAEEPCGLEVAIDELPCDVGRGDGTKVDAWRLGDGVVGARIDERPELGAVIASPVLETREDLLGAGRLPGCNRVSAALEKRLHRRLAFCCCGHRARRPFLIFHALSVSRRLRRVLLSREGLGVFVAFAWPPRQIGLYNAAACRRGSSRLGHRCEKGRGRRFRGLRPAANRKRRPSEPSLSDRFAAEPILG